MMRVEGRDMLQ